MKLLLESRDKSTIHSYYMEYRGKTYSIRTETFIDFFLAANGVPYHPLLCSELERCLPDTDLLIYTAESFIHPPIFEAELRGYYRVPTVLARENIYGETGYANVFSIDTQVPSGQPITFMHHYRYSGSYAGYLKYTSDMFWGNL